MGMQDRDWYKAEKKAERESQRKGSWNTAPKKARRARPVVFIHWIPGFWTGAIAGALVGLTIGLLIHT